MSFLLCALVAFIVFVEMVFNPEARKSKWLLINKKNDKKEKTNTKQKT